MMIIVALAGAAAGALATGIIAGIVASLRRHDWAEEIRYALADREIARAHADELLVENERLRRQASELIRELQSYRGARRQARFQIAAARVVDQAASKGIPHDREVLLGGDVL